MSALACGCIAVVELDGSSVPRASVEYCRMHESAPEVLAASAAVLERIFEVYRPEYVERAAAREPESLLGRCKRLQSAIAKAEPPSPEPPAPEPGDAR